jgi:4-hydroxy-3-methylbut-2-enyl diphosphate reductase
MVKDVKEAQVLAGYIRKGDPAQGQALLEHLGAQAHTEGFDPARDLQYVGMAAQTTMYSSEFLKVSETVRAAVVDRYGESAADHFRELDTICSATQERQDAVSDLARRSDVVFVVGGYNSSNTTNLARVAGQYAPAYHIQGSGQLTAEAIRHQPYGKKAEAVTTGWLPEKPQVVIGMTSGASTPDSVLEAVLHEVLALGKAQP